MIASLRGTILSLSATTVLIDVQGVGYEVRGSRALLERLDVGSQGTVVVYTEVREDAIRLYGFADQLEKQVFMLLTCVKGIGPKSASELLSKVDKTELLRLIAAGDLAQLQAIRGVGKKTAERIVLELKEKVGEYVVESHRGEPVGDSGNAAAPIDEAIEALVALGFARRDAERAVRSVAQSVVQGAEGTGAIVREALRHV